MPGPNSLFYDGSFPGEDLVAEKENWHAAVELNKEFKEQVFLPSDYVETVDPREDAGVFPFSKEMLCTARGTQVALELGNDCKNDGKIIFMRAESSFTLTVYPNIEPFNYWDKLTIVTEDSHKDFTLIVNTKDNREILNLRKGVNVNNTIEWDLSSLYIGLEEVYFTIKAHDNNTEINNIAFEFDIRDTRVNEFGRRTMPTTIIPDSAIVGTLNFKLDNDLTDSQITQANSIFNEYNINGETLLLENFPFSSTTIPFRNDYKNIAVFTEDNKRLKHYILNEQGIKRLYVELPYAKIAKGSMNLKAVIYNTQTVLESATSIFSYIADADKGRPDSNISKTDYPSVVNRQPTTTVLNNEQVITTSPYGSEGFRVGNFDYQEINYLVDFSDTTGITGNIVTFYRNSSIENQTIDANSLVFDWDNSVFGLYGGSKSTVASKVNNMHMEAIRTPNNTKINYLHDRLNKPTYSLPMNGYNRAGEYLVFRSEKGFMKIPWVVSMQNPCSTLFNTRFEDKEYNYIPK